MQKLLQLLRADSLAMTFPWAVLKSSLSPPHPLLVDERVLKGISLAQRIQFAEQPPSERAGDSEGLTMVGEDTLARRSSH
jgi:hypothetical protein